MNKEQKAKKGVVGTVIGVVLCLIFIPIILINVILIVKTYTSPDHIPGVFGIKPVIVLSGSMSPTFETEALIFVRETDPATLKEGDVICYLTGGTAVTHRIDQVVREDGQVRFVTKGDANNTADRLAVLPEQVEGRYIGGIAGLGGFAIFMQSTTGMILFIVLPVLLYLAWDIFRRSRESKAEKRRADELAAQLAELQAGKEEEEKTNVGM